MSRTVLITGGSRGIGAATARRFAAQGDRVAILARESPDLRAVAAELGAPAIPCDVADPEAILGAVAEVEAALGPIDVLINNAGIVHRAPLVGTPLARWRETFAVNLEAPFLLARACVPGMVDRGAGRIVNVASISGRLGTPNLTAYCASKWGLIGFTKALSEELRGTGVIVTAVCPGSVDTDMLKGSGFAPAMTAADVAEAIGFLADAPAAIAGAALDLFG